MSPTGDSVLGIDCSDNRLDAWPADDDDDDDDDVDDVSDGVARGSEFSDVQRLIDWLADDSDTDCAGRVAVDTNITCCC